MQKSLNIDPDKCTGCLPYDTLPNRLLKNAAKVGPTEGKVANPGKMLPKYYELRDWDTQGRLTDEIRSRYGLPA